MRDLVVDLSRLRAVITKFSMNFTDDFKSFERIIFHEIFYVTILLTFLANNFSNREFVFVLREDCAKILLILIYLFLFFFTH